MPPKKKHATPEKQPPVSRGTIITKRRTPEQMKKAKPRAKGWYLQGELIDGCLSRVTLTTGNPGNDAFHHKLTLKVQDDDPEVLSYKIVGSFFMKRSLNDERPLTNLVNDYTRKCFLIQMDPNEMNHEGLLAKMQFLLDFFKRKDNNGYGTPVYLPDDWDTTPPNDQPLRKLNDFLQYTEILRFIRKTSEDAGPSWYEANQDEAWSYFHEGHVPTRAAEDLGFPDDKVTPPVSRSNVNNNPIP